MSTKRKHISLKTKLAACVCQLFLTHDEALALSEDQVLSLVVFDHWPVPHAEGGADEHHNLTARLIADHREKTRKVDVPGIAKRKRVAKAEAEFRARLLKPKTERLPRKSTFPTRPFPKRGKHHGKSQNTRWPRKVR